MSRGEGNHFVVKRYLKIATGNLLMVLQNLIKLLATQFTTLNATMECQKLAVAHRHNLPFMKLLVKNISQFALDKMLRQYEETLKGQNFGHCTGEFQRTYGIPCKHEIQLKVQQEGQFSVADIHPQWVLQKNPLFATLPTPSPATSVPLSPRRNMMQTQQKLYTVDEDQVPTMLAQLQEVADHPGHPLANPVPSAKKRGCPAGSTKRANQRDKSQFEYVAGRKCSKCGVNGHNARTCNQ
ncbi:hypothetical protein CcCBS67573_g08134 [Chytriomyces confervae]|uniref:CCHC-type domain-containing protein n=1 Tax=Chytriomyces confervae TaxID=246404 RepID=A0A507EQ04_9FUNG|nr:hypothetical protein CcCBS67573_g08134 [Chytriomyces confervae]